MYWWKRSLPIFLEQFEFLDENHSGERAVRGPAVAEFEGENGGQGTGFAVSSLYEGCRSLGIGGKNGRVDQLGRDFGIDEKRMKMRENKNPEKLYPFF